MKSPPRKFLFWILWLFELNGTAFLIYCHDDVLSSVTTVILRSNIVLSLLVLARCQCLIGSTLFVNFVNSVRVTTASMLVISLVAIVIEWFFFFLKSNFVVFSLFILHAFFVFTLFTVTFNKWEHWEGEENCKVSFNSRFGNINSGRVS